MGRWLKELIEKYLIGIILLFKMKERLIKYEEIYLNCYCRCKKFDK